MFTDTITYEDYDGNERTEDVYFNLSRAEVFEMEMSVNGGFTAMLERISKSADQQKIMDSFMYLLKKAYGQKSPDGKRFIKSEEITNEFMQTEAYSEFLMKLITDVDYAIKFVTGITPKLSPEDEAVINRQVSALKAAAAEVQ